MIGPPFWFLWLACDALEACLEPGRLYLCKCKQILISQMTCTRKELFILSCGMRTLLPGSVTLHWGCEVCTSLFCRTKGHKMMCYELGASPLPGSKGNVVIYCWYLHRWARQGCWRQAQMWAPEKQVPDLLSFTACSLGLDIFCGVFTWGKGMAGNTDSEFNLLSLDVVLALGSFVTFSKSLI